MSVPKALFTPTIDSIAMRHLKHVQPIDRVRVTIELLEAAASVAEGFLFAPTVSFRVQGENVVLCQLVQFFGVDGVEALLKEGAIEFVLWDQQVAFIETEAARKAGLHPLVPSDMVSDHARDPLASAETGLKGWAPPSLSESDAKRLAKLAADRTVLTPKKIAERTIATVNEAYAANNLADIGLPASTPFPELDRSSVVKLAEIADQAFNAGVMLDRQADLLEEAPVWSALLHLTKSVPTPGGVLRGVQRTLEIEHVPSIKLLLQREVIRFEDVVKLRALRQTEEFRDWLWSREAPQDAGAVADEYLAAMDSKIDIKDRTWFKVARIGFVSLVSAAAGIAAGPLGLAGGAAVGTAIAYADGLGLEKLITRRNPRRFATDVLTPMVARHQNPNRERNRRKRDRQRRR